MVMASPAAANAVGPEVGSSSSAAAAAASSSSSSSGSEESKESALKKPKLLHDDVDDGAFLEGGRGEQVEDGLQVEEKEGGDAGDEEEGYLDYPCYSDSDEEAMEQFRRYDKQIEESEGFGVDFDVVPKVRFFGGVHPIRLNLCDSLLNEILRKSVDTGIDFYNQDKKANLEFVEILKANLSPCSGLMFYITFHARDLGELKNFQTKVFYGWNAEGFCIDVKFTRPKPEINPQ